MAFIGNTVQTQGFTPAVDYFSGNGSTVTFTLTRPVASAAQMIVAVDNVIQNPSSAYTVSGSAITFTSAPLAGTNNIWVEYTSLITTYNAISQSPSVIGDITASGGYLSTGSFNNSFLDGTIVDYVTGNGRITVGSADGFTIYTGGTSARSTLASWSSAGVFTNTGDASISGLTVGKGGGSAANSTVVGNGAVAATNTGDYLTSVGYAALASNTSGAGSTAFGYYALNANTTGRNTGIGTQALKVNTTGSSNTAVGDYALGANTTASNNTAVGYQAGYSNTVYSYHTYVGYQAGYSNVNGVYNTFIGYQAGFNSNPTTPNTNSLNCFIGYYAGQGVTTGTQNTFIGGNASGYQITTGSNHTIIGNYNGNQGGLDIRTNTTGFVVLSTGTGAVMAYSANGSGWYQQNNSSAWATTSDRRIKENITPLQNGLNIIASLNPVSFDYIQTKKSDIGFVAQEYQSVLPNQVTVQQGIDDATNELIGGTNDLLTINQNLVPYLVKAIQELNAKVTALEAKLEAK